MKNQKDLMAVLTALAESKHAGLSIDDLMTSTGLKRTNVANVMKGAVPSGMIVRNADDVTRAPIYGITTMGRDYLARNSKGGSLKAEQTTAPGSDTPCCNAAKVMATTAQDITAELRADLEAEKVDHAVTRSQLDAARDDANRFKAEMEAAKADLENARGLVQRLQAENAEMKEAVAAKTERIEHMDAEIQYKAGVIADLSDKINKGEQAPAAKPLAHIVVSGAIVKTETYDEALEAAQGLLNKGHAVVTVAAVLAEAEVTWRKAA